MPINMVKFTDDFVAEWNGKKVNVNGRNANFDGRYGNQCMDLWNFFLEELGVPKGWTRNPDAAGVWENTKGSYYKQFDGILPSQPARKGDVFIYNRRAWGTGYGHIGIVLADNGNTITVLEMNGLGDGYEDKWMNQYGSPPRIHTWPKTNLYGYLRFIDGFWPDTSPAQTVPPGRYWIVDPGDTLAKIAAAEGVTVDEIRKLNPSITDPNVIRVGQFIDTPEPKTYWTVDPGDTLFGIAKYYGRTVEQLAKFNRLSNVNALAVGQRIYVP
jgi:LysM repeat protein